MFTKYFVSVALGWGVGKDVELTKVIQNHSASLISYASQRVGHTWINVRFAYHRCIHILPAWVCTGKPLQTLTVIHTGHMSLLKQMPGPPPDKGEVLC